MYKSFLHASLSYIPYPHPISFLVHGYCIASLFIFNTCMHIRDSLVAKLFSCVYQTYIDDRSITFSGPHRKGHLNVVALSQNVAALTISPLDRIACRLLLRQDLDSTKDLFPLNSPLLSRSMKDRSRMPLNTILKIS